MSEDDLKRMLARLEARLDRVERELQIHEQRSQPEPPPPPLPQAPPNPTPWKPPAPPPVIKQPPVVATPPKTPTVARPMAAPVRPPAPPPRAGPSLELRIGRSWMAWAGAIVIVIAIAYLVKLGVDYGLWGKIPLVLRCLFIAGFGVLLIAAGDFVRRRIGRAASVGLYGAGLGTLYLDAFAAFEWFERAGGAPLVSREWAFVLMGLVALGGFAVTLQSRFLTIGILSIVGGYLTPILLAGGGAHLVEVGAYLTMLLVVSLALSGVRPSFRPLRYVALGGQAILGLGWVFEAMAAEWTTALVLVSIWWVAVVVEALWAALRGQSAFGNVLASLLSTAWFVTVGCLLLAGTQPAGGDWLGSFTLAVGVIAAVCAMQFGPSVTQLATRPRTAMDKLAIALWAQAGVLMVVAAALQFDGYGQSISWLAIAVASIEIGRRLRLRSVDVFGLVVGALALGRIALLDRGLPSLQPTLFSFGEVTVTNWTILAMVAIVATLRAAHRFRGQVMPVVLAAIAVVGWFGVCRLQCDGLWMTGAWLLGSTILVTTPWGGRQAYLQIGLLALAVTGGKWLLVDALGQRLAPTWDASAGVPLLNGQMGMAAAIAVAAWWAARRIIRSERTGEPTVARPPSFVSVAWQLAFLAGAVLLLIAFSLEIDRVVQAMAQVGRSLAWSVEQVRQLLWTMLWALGSVGVGLLARSIVSRRSDDALERTRGPDLLVRFAWSLLVIVAVKWLISDTLYWTWRTGVGGVLPVANIQMLAGITVAVSALLLHRLTRTAVPGEPGLVQLGALVGVAAALLILWGLSFEVDRAIGRYEETRPSDWRPLWDSIQLRALWLTLLWAAGGLAMMLWTRIRSSVPMLTTGWIVLVLSAFTWLTIDTLAWRLTVGVVPAPVGLNVQFLVGAMTLAFLGIALQQQLVPAPAGRGVALLMIGLLGLWMGSLELDRFFAPESGHLMRNAAMARLAALSIYWGLYAIVIIALGFARRHALSRYAGLGLLTVTLAKVFLVDMAAVSNVYKVLSLLVVGLLFVATSVAYAKLAPRLDPEE